MQRITAVRLEALPDPSLPKGGPGRDHYGNFVLTGFHLTVDDGHGEASVTFSNRASDDQNGGDIEDLLKLPERTYARDVAPGWSIDATRDVTRLPRQAVFVPAQPIAAASGAHARLTLAFDGGAVGQALGRFRLSVTASVDAAAQSSSSARRLRPILAVPARQPDRATSGRISPAFYRRSPCRSKPARDRDRGAAEGTQGARHRRRRS